MRFAEFIISVCGDHVAHMRFYNRGRVGQTATEADALVKILETPEIIYQIHSFLPKAIITI